MMPTMVLPVVLVIDIPTSLPTTTLFAASEKFGVIITSNEIAPGAYACKLFCCGEVISSIDVKYNEVGKGMSVRARGVANEDVSSAV
jgi:hypothetical protein